MFAIIIGQCPSIACHRDIGVRLGVRIGVRLGVRIGVRLGVRLGVGNYCRSVPCVSAGDASLFTNSRTMVLIHCQPLQLTLTYDNCQHLCEHLREHPGRGTL